MKAFPMPKCRKTKDNEGKRLPNRISKTQTFIDLHNYLTSSVIFYILPIQNKWLKCKKWHKCESVPLRIHYLFEYPETPAFKAGTTWKQWVSNDTWVIFRRTVLNFLFMRFYFTDCQSFAYQWLALTHVNLQLKIELIMNELKVTFYLKKNETRADGTVPVLGRIRIGTSMVQFSAKVYLQEKLWDVKSGR